MNWKKPKRSCGVNKKKQSTYGIGLGGPKMGQTKWHPFRFPFNVFFWLGGSVHSMVVVEKHFTFGFIAV